MGGDSDEDDDDEQPIMLKMRSAANAMKRDSNSPV